MASYIYEECGDKYIKKYLIDAGNLTSVHVLGVSYFFEDGNFRGRIQTSALNTADVKRILNLNTKKERLTDFALSTKLASNSTSPPSTPTVLMTSRRENTTRRTLALE